MTETARMYGGSLYDLAAEEGLEARILGELDEAVALFKANPDYLHLLSTPSIPKKERCGLLDEALAPVSERWPGRLTVSELHPPIPGYECPPDHKLVEVVEKLLGAQTEVVNYCTEAPFIQTLCPTLVLGPGSINQAHQPDEYLETRFIKPTRELITQVVHHFCWH